MSCTRSAAAELRVPAIASLARVRDVHIDQVDHLDLDVIAIATTYAPGQRLDAHRHRRAQVLYGATGTMGVDTADGTWTVPPQRAVLIPPSTEHAVRMDAVSTRSLYLEPRAVPWFPARCRVVEVGTLLRELLLAAVELDPRPGERAPGGRSAALLALLLAELRNAAPLPLDLPLPDDPSLLAACRAFLHAPRIDVTPREWAQRLGLSERTLQRRFAAGTGTTLSAWRRRACVLHALPRLAAGHSVTAVAAELGYAGPAAFTTMFRRTLGRPPSSYRDPAWPDTGGTSVAVTTSSTSRPAPGVQTPDVSQAGSACPDPA